MQIERLITVFDNKTEGLRNEINIDYVELEQLKKLFNPPPDDPLMYNVYQIHRDHERLINDLLKERINFDFTANAYYVECAQLPPYDFGKKVSKK